MKILAIDDKEEARYLMEVLLQSRNHHVFTAENGSAALKILKENQVDLIISDILMPEMDGFKFCRLVKENDSTKKIPFIFYTATYVEKKDEEFALGLGADLFLRKPLPPDEFLKIIDDVIEKIKSKAFTFHDTKLKDNSDMYKMYNERLVKKLETKIDELHQEIETRKKIEIKLKKTIEEKEILLKELYHRTRNNMQIICSFIKLYSNKILDKKWWRFSRDIQTKVKTIALVHQKLYESNDLSHLDLKDYFHSLIAMIERNFLPDFTIHKNLDLEPIKVLLDTAIPLGFAFNELVTNALEHGYPDIKCATITVILKRVENKKIELTIQDDGVGLPEDISLDSQKNLGLFLVNKMVVNQLKGKLEFEINNGTNWKITLENEQYSERV